MIACRATDRSSILLQTVNNYSRNEAACIVGSTLSGLAFNADQSFKVSNTKREKLALGRYKYLYDEHRE